MTKKPPYEPPQISPLSHTTAAITRTGPSTQKMISQYGSPLFIAREAQLRNNIQHARQTFAIGTLKTVVAYPYKANRLAALCAILHEEGAWASVACAMEYELATAIGVPGNKILVHGPHKPDTLLQKAIDKGSIIYIDHQDELAAIQRLAEKSQQIAQIGLRIDCLANSTSQFGFLPHQNAWQQALEIIKHTPHMQLIGLHHHTPNATPDNTQQAIACLCDIGQYAQTLGLFPTHINLGGGFPSGIHLKRQHHEQALMPLTSFAHSVQSQLPLIRKTFGQHATLIIEPGRALVDNAVDLACKVIAVKAHHGNLATIIMDAGLNVLPSAYWYRYHPLPIQNTSQAAWQHTRLCGPMNMQTDVVRQRIKLPSLRPDDTLLIPSVGAYNQSQSSAIDQPACVLVGDDQTVHLIQEAKQWQAACQHDRIPEKLRHAYHSFA
jgi:diaminopimelate decarboxylase